MKKNINGRITEIWSENCHYFIEIMVEFERLVLEVSNFDTFNKITRGDIVSVVVSDSNRVDAITRVGGPNENGWDVLSDGLLWRRLTGSPPRMLRLQQRQKIITAIREDLVEHEFLEVETPLLVKGTCPDTHIDSIVAGEGYLVTSTEYQIKRLIVGGFDKIFTLTKNFRNNDRGKYHSSEFTMLEWARSFGSLHEIEEDAIRFIRKAFQRIYPNDVTSLVYEGNEIEFIKEPWERLTVRKGFEIYLGLEDLGDFSLEVMLKSAKKAGVNIPENFQNDQHFVLSYLLDLMQPHLGRKTPTFLQEWPAFMTSSARLSDGDPYAAERSELYISGIEIADGFPFLRDSNLQRQFFDRELNRRKNEGKPLVAIDELYIKTLEQGIPPGAGMALGIDRLVMVLTGASQLKDVQAFGWDEL